MLRAPKMPRPELTAVFALVLLSGCPEGPNRDHDGAVPDLPPFTFPEAGDLVSPLWDSAPPTTDYCAGATTLSLQAGIAVAKGSTKAAVNQYGDHVDCGAGVSLVGPQRYFRVSMKEGATYRITLKPQFEAVFYLFTECTRSLINVDCSSDGATGLFSGPVAAGSSGTQFFVPPATGDYLIAVDSTAISTAGSFELEVEAMPALDHDTCEKAKAIKPDTTGKFTVQGSTIGAKNEFDQQIVCYVGISFDGPQVYYEVDLSGGTWYRIDLTPEFSASLYVVNKAGSCKPGNINIDCGGLTGTVLPLIPPGGTRSTAFRPDASGTYIVAVDSSDPKQAGAFSLAIEPYTPPANMTCDQATAVTLVSGEATVTGDTTALLNDLGAHVYCGKGSRLIAPQAYYLVDLEQKEYQLLLKPAFPAVLAVGSSCQDLPVDCSGLNGTVLEAPAGTFSSVLFTPKKAGSYLLVVDGVSTDASGSFTLQVKEATKPANGVCGQAKVLPLTVSPFSEVGDTGPFSNDLVGVSCGSPQGPWPGPQSYYSATLKAGVSYTVTLTPEPTFDPSLYAFAAPAGCTAPAVDAACQGQASDNLGAGVGESITLTPAVDTVYVLVVDSWSASEVGKFTLSISW